MTDRTRDRTTGKPRQRRPQAKPGSKLTVAEAPRVSLDSLTDFDRLAASQAIARHIARLLFDHEKRRISGGHAPAPRSTASRTR